jgi:hypothetical protein
MNQMSTARCFEYREINEYYLSTASSSRKKERKTWVVQQYGLPQQAGRIANDELAEMFCVYL